MFEPLLAAPMSIQIHALSALVALVLGPFALYRRKRDILHKSIGYIWALAMAGAIGSSFLIFQIRILGPFSPIHILSLFATWNLFRGIRAAITGDISVHQATMKGLYFWALGLAGTFALMPGRIMGRVLFGSHQEVGFAAVLLLIVTIISCRFIWPRRGAMQG